MTIVLKSNMNKRHIRQSSLILWLFCVTFFYHNTHTVEVDLELLSIVDQHDCSLCQQAIDSTQASISLGIIITDIFSRIKMSRADIVMILSVYIQPPARAPPYSW